jgi:hypothetical protein
MDFKSYVAYFYYAIGGVGLVLVLIRNLYTWFRDFDNTQRFASDMALIHLPHIYDCLGKIADKMEITLERVPPVNFSYIKPNPGYKPLH